MSGYTMSKISVVRERMRELDIQPNRALGQNFLVDGNILDIILAAAEVERGDRILEIGPGMGALTEALLVAGADIVAIEKDARMLPALNGLPLALSGLDLIEGDAVALAADYVKQRGIKKVVANLPYSPGSRIMVELLTQPHELRGITVMVQREVAQRLTASAATKSYGLLRLWAGIFFEPEYVKTVSPNCFWPRPSVSSAVVHFMRKPAAAIPLEGIAYFRRLTHEVFCHRRKQLLRVLSDYVDRDFRLTADRGAFMLDALGVRVDARPEALSPNQWYRLSEALRTGAIQGVSDRGDGGN